MTRRNSTKEYIIIVFDKWGTAIANYYRFGKWDADMKGDEERRNNPDCEVIVRATGY